MSRPPREEIAGGVFHVMNRGNRKQIIFQDDRDRRRYLRISAVEQRTHGVEICAGCLMGNHFHKVIVTPYGNLSDFVGAVESRFADYSNWRYGNVGHLFQGRFISIPIEDDIQLLTAVCYVFLNPVCAGLVKNIEDYRWSTFRATVGLEPVPHYLSLDWLTTLFPGVELSEAQRRFRAVMAEAKPVVSYLREQEMGVDPAALKRVVRSFIGEKRRIGALPRLYRSALRDSLPELFPAALARPDLEHAIYNARVVHGYKIIEVARHLQMHRDTVSRLFRAAAERNG
jgi:putative transposase